MENAPQIKKSAMEPIVDKVGVPLMWLAVGFIIAKVTSRKKQVVAS